MTRAIAKRKIDFLRIVGSERDSNGLMILNRRDREAAWPL
jgi:hypothetical protein